jgi:hypothetical protein
LDFGLGDTEQLLARGTLHFLPREFLFGREFFPTSTGNFDRHEDNLLIWMNVFGEFIASGSAWDDEQFRDCLRHFETGL